MCLAKLFFFFLYMVKRDSWAHHLVSGYEFWLGMATYRCYMMKEFDLEACPNDLHQTDPFLYYHFVSVSLFVWRCLTSEFCFHCEAQTTQQKFSTVPLSSTLTGRGHKSRPFFRTKCVQVEASSGPCFFHPSLLLACLWDAFVFVSWELVPVSSLFVGFCMTGIIFSFSGYWDQIGPGF